MGRVPENAFLVTADVAGLYPSIPHKDGLDGLSKKLEEKIEKNVPTEHLVLMANLYLKTIFLSSILVLNIKYQEQPLGPSLPHHMHVSLWIRWKRNF